MTNKKDDLWQNRGKELAHFEPVQGARTDRETNNNRRRVKIAQRPGA